MKIAILGGGFTGLSAAHYLQAKGHTVTIFEKEEVLGGLAAGFTSPNWEWPLERVYHHGFTSDSATLGLAKEIGFTDFIYRSPESGSMYKDGDNYRIFPLDTPQGLLQFPLLSWPAKLRVCMLLAFFKFGPLLRVYGKESAASFLKKYTGEEAWRIFWEPLFRKKFGKHAEKILTAFIWARVKVRTKQLIYMKGGFQTFIDAIEQHNRDRGVIINKGYQVQSIGKKTDQFELLYSKNGEEKRTQESFDAVISTLPTAIMSKVTANLFPQEYLDRFKKLEYMHAMNLILETDKPLHKTAYWLSSCVKEFPFLVTLQHTNFIDKKYYGGNHILYVGTYVDGDDKILKMNKDETIAYLLPYLKNISENEFKITNSFHFKAGYAQPIFSKEFVENMPTYETPIKNFFIANLDMTYPQDRGTNFAIALGKKVSEFIK